MSGPGSLAIVGLGPGAPEWLTPEASDRLAQASDIIGYGPYVARLPQRAGQRRHTSANRVEIDRARHALQLACAGHRVAVVSGGDPGVFAMAAAVLEAVEAGPREWQGLDIAIVPGISAMMAAAARLGAPLGHDFCAISLSDNLKPWAMVERRLRAAIAGDFVIAIYNPASKARPAGIFEAFAVLRAGKAASTPVAFARAVGHADETLVLGELGTINLGDVDMSTLVIIGSSQTRLIARGGLRPWLLTPRSYGAVP